MLYQRSLCLLFAYHLFSYEILFLLVLRVHMSAIKSNGVAATIDGVNNAIKEVIIQSANSSVSLFHFIC